MSEAPAEHESIVEETATSSIEWLELFFDLVVVAAVAVLTEGLRENPTLGGFGLFALLYAGIWFSWTSIVLYANVAKSSTRTRTVITGMFLVAVMAATAPIHNEHRANVFAAGFLILRVVAAQSSLRTGRVLATWPLLQFGGLALPWIVAMWVDAPWKYVLWGAGLVVDLLMVLSRRTLDEESLDRIRERMAGERRPDGRPSGGRSGAKRAAAGQKPVEMSIVDVDPEHLQERLGLFVIIVLGEIVSQLVFAASTTDWTDEFTGSVIAIFLVLVGLWWLTFSYGFVGAPHTRMALMQPRFGLPMHLLTTMGVIAMAAGFGEIAVDPGEHLGTALRWIMCAGLGLHFLVMGISGASGGAPKKWTFGWALPCALLPIVVGLLGPRLSNEVVVWLFVLPIVWMAVYGRVVGLGPSDGSQPTD